jgi:hypothetical protein
MGQIRGMDGNDGEKGDQGEKGDKGDAGETFKVSGVVPTSANLPAAPAPLTVLMTQTPPGNLFIYDRASAAANTTTGWVNLGQIAGPQGIKGDKGDDGKGLSPYANQSWSAGSVVYTPDHKYYRNALAVNAGDPAPGTVSANQPWTDITPPAVTEIAKLSDANITSPQDNQTLVYNATTSKWVNALNDNAVKIRDWEIARAYVPNETVYYSGSFWRSSTPGGNRGNNPKTSPSYWTEIPLDYSIANAKDVTANAPVANSTLVYDGIGKWESKPLPQTYSKVEIDQKVQTLVTGIVHGESVVSIADDPPLTPVQDEVFLIGIAPTGLFTGHANELAFWDGAAWKFVAPQTGESHLVEDQDAIYHWNGTKWVKIATGSGLPAGGATNQALVKTATGYAWKNLRDLILGGYTAGATLTLPAYFNVDPSDTAIPSDSVGLSCRYHGSEMQIWYHRSSRWAVATPWLGSAANANKVCTADAKGNPTWTALSLPKGGAADWGDSAGHAIAFTQADHPTKWVNLKGWLHGPASWWPSFYAAFNGTALAWAASTVDNYQCLSQYSADGTSRNASTDAHDNWGPGLLVPEGSYCIKESSHCAFEINAYKTNNYWLCDWILKYKSSNNTPMMSTGCLEFHTANASDWMSAIGMRTKANNATTDASTNGYVVWRYE